VFLFPVVFGPIQFRLMIAWRRSLRQKAKIAPALYCVPTQSKHGVFVSGPGKLRPESKRDLVARSSYCY